MGMSSVCLFIYHMLLLSNNCTSRIPIAVAKPGLHGRIHYLSGRYSGTQTELSLSLAGGGWVGQTNRHVHRDKELFGQLRNADAARELVVGEERGRWQKKPPVSRSRGPSNAPHQPQITSSSTSLFTANSPSPTLTPLHMPKQKAPALCLSFVCFIT